MGQQLKLIDQLMPQTGAHRAQMDFSMKLLAISSAAQAQPCAACTCLTAAITARVQARAVLAALTSIGGGTAGHVHVG